MLSSRPDTASLVSRPASASGTVETLRPEQRELRTFIVALFFAWGGITSLNDIIIPRFKGLFTLSNGEVMLVQSAFFASYFLFSLPGAAVTHRLGYLRTAVVGLLLMTCGCLLFVPAAAAAEFSWFLGALFVLGAGITVLQVTANPLISLLGPPTTAHSRLTFAQAFKPRSGRRSFLISARC